MALVEREQIDNDARAQTVILSMQYTKVLTGSVALLRYWVG